MLGGVAVCDERVISFEDAKMKNDHSDSFVIGGIVVFFTLGLWMGFSLSTERLCGVRATVPLLIQQVVITLMGE
jgi:hypothetical protein